MRIAIVTHNVLKGDGQGRVNYELAHHALRQGCQVSLVADRVDADLERAGAHWIRVQPRWNRINLIKVWAFTQLSNRALDRCRGQFDIIHAYGYTTTRPHHVNTAQFVHAAWARSPMHTARVRSDLYGAYQWLYSRANTAWERQAYRAARLVVAASTLVKQELSGIGIGSDRISVITNAVDPQEFSPGQEDRAQLGLPVDVPLALFAGDIRTPRKNLDTVLHALSRSPGIHLAVVGAVAGSPYPHLATKLRIDDRVHFLGFRRDVPQLMRSADVFVFPSRYEPFGIVVLEAMASGIPVITASTVGAAALVDRRTGFVLEEPDDVQRLAVALTELLEDPTRRHAMGHAARLVAEQHTWHHMADAYLALYREVLA